MLEKWRIWWRINWKQYSKENTKMPEQVRDEDFSIKKEKKRAGEGVEIKSAMVADGVPSGFMGSNGNGEDHRLESTDERL